MNRVEFALSLFPTDASVLVTLRLFMVILCGLGKSLLTPTHGKFYANEERLTE